MTFAIDDHFIVIEPDTFTPFSRAEFSN